ncbi:MAG: metal-binding protein [Methylococcaceae bacterium]|nr:metal-binding protein [Methylococcaceae bacterium]
MLDRLPDFIDPLAFADRQRQLVGEIALNKLARLADLLSDDKGVISVDLSFSKDGRLAIIQGRIKADLKVECQSCLETMDWPLDLDINLAAVKSLEIADKLAGVYEPLILEEQRISFNELIEDELLLALPDFPRHQQNCMKSQASASKSQADDEAAQSSPNNPFSILAQLKNTGDQ